MASLYFNILKISHCKKQRNVINFRYQERKDVASETFSFVRRITPHSGCLMYYKETYYCLLVTRSETEKRPSLRTTVKSDKLFHMPPDINFSGEYSAWYLWRFFNVIITERRSFLYYKYTISDNLAIIRFVDSSVLYNVSRQQGTGPVLLYGSGKPRC
jgi:hypothetical protein